MNRAVFFDRDGTLMEDVHYCADPRLVRVYEGVPDALRRLKQAGFYIFLITNQSGIGRGIMTEAQYFEVQAELLRQIGPGLIDGTYFCPDAPETPSLRRKPQPGMVLEAAKDYQIDLQQSYFVGDKAADVECGQRAGTLTIQVSTGYGLQQKANPTFRAKDIITAVEIVLEPSSG